jgi:hypothetical protein
VGKLIVGVGTNAPKLILKGGTHGEEKSEEKNHEAQSYQEKNQKALSGPGFRKTGRLKASGFLF